MDRQGVHIGPQTHRADGVAGSQSADDAGLADTAEDLAAKLRELRRHQIGGALLLKAEFGVSVNIAPPIGQIVMNFGDSLDQLHDGSSDGCKLSSR